MYPLRWESGMSPHVGVVLVIRSRPPLAAIFTPPPGQRARRPPRRAPGQRRATSGIVHAASDSTPNATSRHDRCHCAQAGICCIRRSIHVVWWRRCIAWATALPRAGGGGWHNCSFRRRRRFRFVVVGEFDGDYRIPGLLRMRASCFFNWSRSNTRSTSACARLSDSSRFKFASNSKMAARSSNISIHHGGQRRRSRGSCLG